MQQRLIKRIKAFSKSYPGLIAISIVYLLVVIYMLPFREQTYLDDAAYILSVKNYVTSGNFKVIDWSAASLIFPMFYGALFAKIFGFSLKILQISTVVLLYPSLICFYLTLRRFIKDEFRSTFFTLLLLACPWIILFTYSFLTDIPYMCLMIISIYFYVRGLQDKSTLPLFLGSLFASFAFLTRQLGVALPVSILLLLLYQTYIRQKVKLTYFVASLLPFTALAAIYYFWLSQPGNMTYSQNLAYTPHAYQHSILPYLFPLSSNLRTISISNRLYVGFAWVIVFYINNIIVFLAPAFIMFRLNLKQILKFLNTHKKTIIFSILIYLFLFSMEQVQHNREDNYTYGRPDLIINHNRIIPFDPSTDWKYVVIFSLLIFLPLVGVSVKKLILTLSEVRRKYNKKMFRSFLVGYLILNLIIFCAAFVQNYQHKIPYTFANHGLTAKTIGLITLFFSFYGQQFITQSWLALLSVFIIPLIMVCFMFKFKIRREINGIDTSILLPLLVFLIEVSFLTFLPSWGIWAQYVICLIPLAILWVANTTKNWAIRYPLALVILVLMFIFSTSVAKDRYANNGIRFELGTKLVEQGVQPCEMQGHEWSWLEWWYLEPTFAEAVKSVGGDKYKLEVQRAFHLYDDYPLKYTFVEVPVDYDPQTDPATSVAIDSGPQDYDLFTKTRYIITGPKKNTK